MDFFVIASRMVNSALMLLIGIGTLVFFYGVIQYVIAQGDKNKLDEGKKYMLYGIIGLVAMVSVWGIVQIILVTVFGTGYRAIISDIPGVPTFDSGYGSTGGTCVEIDRDTGFCISQSTTDNIIDTGLDIITDTTCGLLGIGCGN